MWFTLRTSVGATEMNRFRISLTAPTIEPR